MFNKELKEQIVYLKDRIDKIEFELQPAKFKQGDIVQYREIGEITVLQVKGVEKNTVYMGSTIRPFCTRYDRKYYVSISKPTDAININEAWESDCTLIEKT